STPPLTRSGNGILASSATSPAKCYTRDMTRFSRATTAIVLALAFAAVPLVADWCAISCEAAHSTTASDAPTCHHTSSTPPRIDHLPTPCGHDNHSAVVDATATTAVVVSRTVVTLPALVGGADVSTPQIIRITVRAGPSASSPTAL